MRAIRTTSILFLVISSQIACQPAASVNSGSRLVDDATVAQTRKISEIQMPNETTPSDAPDSRAAELELATFGSGCFWCTEGVFLRVKGVEKVVSGYTGGHVENPTYKQVCAGTTGHAEVIQVSFDPAVVSYADLLEIFWKTHDPTTLNRQGNDVGTQYRSSIFYHNEAQKKEAEHYKKKLDASGAFNRPIVTEIVPIEKFYPAEDYHQNYFALNPGNPYCQYVIVPKLEKLQKVFKDKLKKVE